MTFHDPLFLAPSEPEDASFELASLRFFRSRARRSAPSASRRYPDLHELALPSGWSARALSEADRGALLDHWMSLSTEDLYSRFFHLPSSEALSTRARSLPLSAPDGKALGVFNPRGRLVASCEWALCRPPSCAEASFSTLPEARGLGLALVLARACGVEARAHGALTLRIDALSTNKGALSLARRLGARVETGDCLSERLCWIDLGGPEFAPDRPRSSGPF